MQALNRFIWLLLVGLFVLGVTVAPSSALGTSATRSDGGWRTGGEPDVSDSTDEIDPDEPYDRTMPTGPSLSVPRVVRVTEPAHAPAIRRDRAVALWLKLFVMRWMAY